MKKIMFALVVVPFLAACWSKKETVETVTQEVMKEQNPVVDPSDFSSEEMPGMADNVKSDDMSDEMSDEK